MNTRASPWLSPYYLGIVNNDQYVLVGHRNSSEPNSTTSNGDSEKNPLRAIFIVRSKTRYYYYYFFVSSKAKLIRSISIPSGFHLSLCVRNDLNKPPRRVVPWSLSSHGRRLTLNEFADLFLPKGKSPHSLSSVIYVLVRGGFGFILLTGTGV